MADTRASSRVTAVSLPFREAIEHHRQKVNVPTETYQDLTKGAHARAFTVAGATKEELLADFRAAVDKALAEGRTLRDFQKDFDAIVKRHGWEHTGTPGFRARTIYQTNLRTAYQTGRYQQQQAIKHRRPYWRYRHGGSANPRRDHLKWDGLILHADDPWWSTHYPPNGWGCSCRVETLSERDMKRLGLEVGEAPSSPESTAGIDEGWDYSVGEAAHGRQLAEEAMNQWREQGADVWEQLSPGSWETAGRPARVPSAAPPVPLVEREHTREGVVSRLRDVLGGEERTFVTPGGGVVNVNAVALGDHLDPPRATYLPLLPHVLEEPFEVWQTFERHKGTGKVVLRTRYIRSFETDEKYGHIIMVAQASNGRLEAHTFVPRKSVGLLNRWRLGRLLFARE